MVKVTHNQLAALGRDERDRVLDAVEARLNASRKPGVDPAIVARLKGFEARLGMSTDDMLTRVASGVLQEDGDIAAWLFWAHAAKRARGVR
jgi:hypothetical protein